MDAANPTAQTVRRAAQTLRQRLVSAQETGDEGRIRSEIFAALDECLLTLAGTQVWGESNRLLSSELWNIAGDLLETGWLQTRARQKPRGYAGDHELLRRIVLREESPHPLGRHLDAYFQYQAAPQAVRNRTALAAEWIASAVRSRSGNCRIVLVGSGPACELEIAGRNLPPEMVQRIHAVLMDMDGEALEQARARLIPLLAEEQLTLAQGNLFRLPQKPELAAPLRGADLLLCLGLFDYLDAEAASKMLAKFWRSLAPGGSAAVFNFAPHNPTRAYMEWLGNWYLIYRTEQELAALARAAGIPAHCWKLAAEPLGVDLYLQIRKPESVPNSPV